MSAETAPAEACREALAIVLYALDIPHAATVGHDETRQKILNERVRSVVVFLEQVLSNGDREVAWSISWLRDRLAATRPVGYVTSEQAREAVSRGASWVEAVTLPEEEAWP